MNTNRSNRTFRRGGALLLSAVIASSLAAPAIASASTPSDEVKQQFRELVQQRNRLARDLAKADEQAADGLRNQRDPVGVHARQQSIEHELDLVQLRLETMAVRHGLPLPEMPTPASIEETRRANATRASSAFDGGRERARRVLERDAQRLLGSLDFTAFLAAAGR